MTAVHDPGGLGFRITELWAWVAVHDDGDEGVLGVGMGGWMMPLVAADRERVESLRPYAENAAQLSGKRAILARFTLRIDEEIVDP